MTTRKRTKRDVKRSLTKRQARFLQEFPKDLNATQAARRAGYSARTAKQQGQRLLKQLHQHVDQFVDRPQKPALAPAAIAGLQRYVQQIERLAYFDPRKLFDSHGNPIEIPSLGDDEASSIAGFKFYEDYEGKGESRKAVGYTREFKLADRISALSLLGKVHGFYHEKGDRGPTPLEQAATELLLEMKAMIEQRQKGRDLLLGGRV